MAWLFYLNAENLKKIQEKEIFFRRQAPTTKI